MQQSAYPALITALLLCLVFFISCHDDDDDSGDDDNDDGGGDDDDDDMIGEDDNDDETGEDDDDDVTGDDDNDDATGDDDMNDDDDIEGVWTDPISGLMWQNTTDCCYNYLQAKRYCKNLTWGGYNDWRVPTISELRSLIRGCPGTSTGGSCQVTDSCIHSLCWDYDCGGCISFAGPGPSGRYWPADLKGDGWYFWSSMLFADLGLFAWYVNFTNGLVTGKYIFAEHFVRCVRE